MAPRSPANTTARRLEEGALLRLDGATGTELERRGIASELPLWSTIALLEAPEALVEIHAAYAGAGAEVITANTFRTQSRVLSRDARTRGLARELSRLAVDCARRGIEKAGARCWVAGSAPPLEDCYRPDWAPEREALEREHAEHAEHLAESGVDLLLVETMNNAEEARAAAHAAKRTGLPFWVSFICDARGELLSGEALAHAIERVVECEPELVAINCLPPSAVEPALAVLSDCGLPFGVYANLGAPYPNSPDQRVEDHDPASFRGCAQHWVDAGAHMIGGCCGTTPDHIRALGHVT